MKHHRTPKWGKRGSIAALQRQKKKKGIRCRETRIESREQNIAILRAQEGPGYPLLPNTEYHMLTVTRTQKGHSPPNSLKR